MQLHERIASTDLGPDFTVLALFAVVEMLLTHQPGDKEIGDSLTHQIVTKIPLLESRMGVPPDYGVFGSDVDRAQVWRALYHYRSCIAHGNHYDFAHRVLGVLGDPAKALSFMRVATRRVLRFALDEPVLYDSLKRV
jgi:hypothetical protein